MHQAVRRNWWGSKNSHLLQNSTEFEGKGLFLSSTVAGVREECKAKKQEATNKYHFFPLDTVSAKNCDVPNQFIHLRISERKYSE
jgi:hypothetical protein